ncbi:hypothetical protein M426DRAFT_318513 [Hypoxylon sp. CI-4A]|nr:hypothetical protein M426DRAFT_318513 [Hypoxylon sp. CI-4A]
MKWGPYPALVPQEGGEVKGLYWKCEVAKHVADLCAYESHAYRIEYCDIITAKGDVIKEGRVFVWDDIFNELEEGVFDLKEYIKTFRF